jgi:hypothetical protein
MRDFFVKREQGILYLKSNSLVFFTKSKYFVGELKFEASVVKYMEVLNKRLLQRSIVEFIQAHGLENLSPVFIVSKDLVFDLAVNQRDYEELKTLQLFKDNLPFEQTKLKVAVIQIEDNYIHLGVNGDYVDSVVEAVQNAKNEIQAAIPEQLVSVLFEKETFLSKKFNELVLENLSIVKNYDLFSKNKDKKVISLK